MSKQKSQPEIIIQQQKRKSFSMRVNPAGQVIVSIPRYVKPNSREVKKFIKHGLAKLAAHIPDEQAPPLHDAESIRACVDHWAGVMNLHPKRVQMREMTRKWGSCSSIGSVTLNTALYWLPQHLVDYVVVHELAHLEVLDHSPKFWALVEQYMPDWEARRKEINTYRV